jgi:hypothetical protein
MKQQHKDSGHWLNLLSHHLTLDAVLQDKTTGKIEVIGDYRMDNDAPDVTKVIDFTYFYPYNFKNPFAAYLIPPDLQVGETVMLEDLIEDIVGSTWNQGDTYRLKSCKAVWDGKEFILQYNPDNAMQTIIG